MSRTAKNAVIIMVATLLSRVLGFLRETILANFYGTSMVADVFVLTFNIPGLIISIVGSVIYMMYIPMYYDTRDRLGEDEALKFTNNILNILSVFSIIVSILGIIFASEIIKIFAIGFTGEKFALAVKFLRIMMFGVLFLSLNKIQSSFLQVKDSYLPASIVGVVYNLIIIGAIFISVKYGSYYLAIGALVGLFVQVIILLPCMYKRGYKYSFYMNIKDESIIKMIKLSIPMMMGVAMSQLNVYVDKALASTLGDGKLSALNYASRLNDFVVAIFVTSLITVIYPKLSQFVNEKDITNFKKIMVKSSNCIILVVVPIVFGAILLAEPIVRVLLERGSFSHESTLMTSNALRFYAIGIIGYAVKEILSRGFYSLGDTKTPMINSSIAVIINIILDLLFIKPFSYMGLAMATSISYMVTVVLMFFSLRKKVGSFNGRAVAQVLIKSIIASIAMSIVVLFTYDALVSMLGLSFIGECASLGGAILLGVVVYAICIKLFKVEEIKVLEGSIKNFFSR